MHCISHFSRIAAAVLLLSVVGNSSAQQPNSLSASSTAASNTKIKGFYIGMPFDEAVKAADEVAKKMGDGASTVTDKESHAVYVGRKKTIFGNVVEVGAMNSFIRVETNPQTQMVDYLQFTKDAFNARDTATNVFVSNLTIAYKMPQLTPTLVKNPVTNEPDTAYEGISDSGFKVFIDPLGLVVIRASKNQKASFD